MGFLSIFKIFKNSKPEVIKKMREGSNTGKTTSLVENGVICNLAFADL
jgi:hypothetical protein